MNEINTEAAQEIALNDIAMSHAIDGATDAFNEGQEEQGQLKRGIQYYLQSCAEQANRSIPDWL